MITVLHEAGCRVCAGLSVFPEGLPRPSGFSASGGARAVLGCASGSSPDRLAELSFWSSLAKLWRRRRDRDPSRACCEAMQWKPVADFGSVTGIDLDLGRCEACGKYVMCVSYYGSGNYVRITEERAKYLLALQHEDPERLRKVLKAWVN